MTPLGMVVAGLVLVVVDFRYNGLDLVPDLVGWAVVLGGLVKLLTRSRWFTAAAIAASGGIAIGLPLLVAESGRLLSAVESVVMVIVVFGTCSGIRDVAAGDRTRHQADLIRWTCLVLTSVALAVGLFVEPTVVTGSAGLVVVVAVLAVLAYVAWLFVFLWTNRDDPALGASGPASRPDPAV
ncbi:hypothetical protein [Nocardioides zhouii]|uniref:DUF308 domain-containing protein n=1 Tax=Nocardioides zhouii TaxID=1168729 RepID=A0A4Q2T9A2_9ACTN|nr:hypothetical protein [Nocardioides zhouii]RYC13664.1 hypothetical protein EUA94_03370 [Nocardioides zhouii]